MAQGHNEQSPELALLKQGEMEWSMASWLRGGIYIIDGKPHVFGGKLRTLPDYRPGREHLLFPAVQQLVSYWTPVHVRQNGDLSHFGNGLWDTAQMLWHQWSTGTRSGKLETAPPSPIELKQLQQVVDRDWPDKKIQVAACSFQYPTGFVSTVGTRLRRVRLFDHVYVQVQDKTRVVQITKAVTVVLPAKEAVTYVFADWYKDAKIDDLTQCRLVRPEPAGQPFLPFQLGALVEQVMVLHRCYHACKRRECKDRKCDDHLCRTLPCCPAHARPECKDAECIRQPYRKTRVHYRPAASDYFVFDHDTGFVPDNPPLPLVDVDDVGL